MKHKILLAIQLFFTSYIFATVQPSLAQAKDFASKVSWAFEENKGQVTGLDSAQVRYFYKQGNLTMFLLKDRLAYQFNKTIYPEGYQRQFKIDINHHPEEKQIQDSLSKLIYQETYRMDIELVGANPHAEAIAEGKSPDYIQYYNHNALEVHAYQKITYKNIYPNIDWVIYQSQDASSKLLEGSKNSQLATSNSQLIKYDFIIHPGGDPSLIKLKTHWTDETKINPDGSLSMICSMGEVTEQAPVSFQEGREIKTVFHLSDNIIDFDIAKYDTSKELIIDPFVRIWGTYYGGSGNEAWFSCHGDLTGNIYLAGYTSSTSNISSGGHQNSFGGINDAFLIKFNSSGTRMWATYYGGSGDDNGLSCRSDLTGNIYLAGQTSSSSNISSGGHQNSLAGIYDAFLVKFNSSGTRIWATYYGGSGDETSYSSHSDLIGNIYLAGYTTSSSNISSGGHQNSFGGINDAFLVKFNSSGTRIWATYYGGSGDDYGFSCHGDLTGNIYLAGHTSSAFNISSGGYQNSRGGGIYDAFLVKFIDSVTPKITIYKNKSDTICFGSSVLFFDTINYGGTTPKLKWYKNNILVDTNHTYTTFSLKNGDSIYCVLTSNHLYRTKDTVWSNVIRMFINPLSSHILYDTICSNQSKWFNGANRFKPGIYLDTLLNSNSCDSFLTLNLFVKSSDTLHKYDTMCELQSYWFNNQNIYSSGLYRDTFSNLKGCDSFVFLHLLVKDTSLHEFTYVSPCDSISYMFDGISRTLQGKYTAIDTNVLGCDSTTILNLFFRKPTHTRLSPVQICPSTSYVFDGIARTAAGDYIRYYSNADGCPSTDSLRISILSSPARQTNPISACAPYTFKGKTYTSSAIVIDTIKSIVGNCDSVYLSNLIQLKPPPTTASEVNIIVCDSIRLNNRLYTNSFSFIDTFRTVGTVCDSVYRKTNYTISYTPQIGLKERDTFMRGSQVTLKPFSVTNYLWSTGETTKNLSFKLTEDRQLYLIAWNEEPCRDTAYISLVAEDLAIVGMPTGFSPTGEYPENRTLRPNINGRLEYFHMMVFNRWGEKVYETFYTQPLGWNGIFKGEPAPAGLYGYVLEYRTLGSIFTKSGEVMLVR